jgi:hypothetical protein
VKLEKFPTTEDCSIRHADRVEVILLSEVRQGTAPWAMVRLEDISPTGFRIAWLPICSVDKPIRIRIPGLNLLTAQIVWREGKTVGCAFQEPLHVAVFEHIVRRSMAAD